MKLAVFDFDGTLFPQDTLPFLLSQWKKMKYPKIKYYKTLLSVVFMYVIFKSGVRSKLTREDMKKSALAKFNMIFSGMPQQEIAQFFAACAEAITKRLNETVVNEIKKARTEGFHTVLLSGAYEDLTELIGRFLDIDTVIGTKIYFINGIIDLDKPLEIISGNVKLEKIKKYFNGQSVDWDASTAYADSYSDSFILQAMGRPVAVKPDNKLKAVAVEKGWRIIN